MISLFIQVLQGLSGKFHTCVPLELLYANDLVIITDNLEELIILFKEQERRDGIPKTGSYLRRCVL